MVVVVVGLNGQRQSLTDDWSLGLTFDIHMAPNVDYLRDFDGKGVEWSLTTQPNKGDLPMHRMPAHHPGEWVNHSGDIGAL